mmetsp:Transcript_21236/g.50355  ORF Transcript_21236/g.50355 Transcript_21236/m.50355 type:complete len:331 (-) Transcript_21236:91-1083(-)
MCGSREIVHESSGDLTPSRCPVRVEIDAPDLASQTLTLLSTPVDTTWSVLGRNATATTGASWGQVQRTMSGRSISNTRTSLSTQAVAMRPSRLDRATASMVSVCPAHVATVLATGGVVAKLSVVSLAVPSAEPVSTKLVSLKSMHRIASRCSSPGDTLITVPPSRGFHTRRLALASAEMMWRPSAEKPPQVTSPPCPVRHWSMFPAGSIHTHTEKSAEPATTTLPRGCHANQLSSAPGPSKACTRVPSAVFQTLRTPSIPAVASKEPSKLKATCTMVSVCPFSSAIFLPSAHRHKAAVSSSLPVATMSGSTGCNATECTADSCPTSWAME